MNDIVVYRETELDQLQYERLDQAAHRHLVFKERIVERVVWTTDEHGDKVQVREPELMGMEVFKKGEIPQQVLDALQRPVVPRHAVLHLQRLAAHLPYGRGEEGFQMVLEDLAKDLADVSEYAIIKTCERFRLDEDLTFFPASALIVRYARGIDWSLKNLKAEKEAPPVKEPEQVSNFNRTFKQRRRVKRLVSLIAKQYPTRWEKKFLAAYPRHAKGT